MHLCTDPSIYLPTYLPTYLSTHLSLHLSIHLSTYLIYLSFAGDIISEFAVAIDRKLKLPQLATVMHVYPAISIAVQQLAAEVRT